MGPRDVRVRGKGRYSGGRLGTHEGVRGSKEVSPVGQGHHCWGAKENKRIWREQDRHQVDVIEEEGSKLWTEPHEAK